MPYSRSTYPLLCLSLALSGVCGCISDFSPEPTKGPQNVSPTPDSGSALAPTGVTRDAGVNRDAGAPMQAADAGKIELPPSLLGPCDLSGSWIVTERSQIAAFGARQASRTWFYVELTQKDDALVVAKSLMCGGAVQAAPGEVFMATVDDRAAWPAYQRLARYDGRKGTSRNSGAGCDVSFDPDTLVRGMTPDYYKDLDHTLPSLSQKQTDSTPGWADWDNDGNPGISLIITGTVSGTLYTGLRVQTLSLSGSVPHDAASFKLDNFDWMQERIVYGTREPDPAGILSSAAERDPSAGVNFVEFARLSAEQAAGSDDDLCNTIRTLAPTLNPAANPP